MPRRTVLSLLAVVCGLAAVVGAGLKLTTDESTQVRGNTLVQSSSPIVAINTPSIRRNPTDGSNVAITYRVNYDYFSAFLGFSTDGGRTFGETTLPVPSGIDACAATLAGRPCPFAADLAYDSHGTLYVVYVNLEGRGNVPQNLWLSKSTDGGRTLGPPTRIAGRLTFQPRIAIAPDDTIHLTWLQATEVATLSLVGPAPVVSAHSTDGGETFTDPVVVSDTQRERVGAASPVVDGNGVVTVLYQDFKADRRDFENLDGPSYEEPFSLVITRSSDGGSSWTPGVELEAGVIPSGRFLVFLPEFPALATGPGQTLYATWADGRNGDKDVFVKRSRDGGATWTAAVRVNDSPLRDGTDQNLPTIAVNDAGRVHVLFLDRSADPENNLADVVIATSDDDGVSWDLLTVSSAPTDARVGPPPIDPKLGIDFGSRLGLDVAGDRAFVAWPDTRESDENFGAQDIGVTAVSFGADPPFLGRVPVVIGLFAIGLLALGALWLRPDGAAKAPAAASATTPGPAPGETNPAEGGRKATRKRRSSGKEASP